MGPRNDSLPSWPRAPATAAPSASDQLGERHAGDHLEGDFLEDGSQDRPVLLLEAGKRASHRLETLMPSFGEPGLDGGWAFLLPRRGHHLARQPTREGRGEEAVGRVLRQEQAALPQGNHVERGPRVEALEVFEGRNGLAGGFGEAQAEGGEEGDLLTLRRVGPEIGEVGVGLLIETVGGEDAQLLARQPLAFSFY